jgi:phage terminase large subunit-like protein
MPSRSTSPGTKLSRAERNIAWIETHCVIPEGKDIGKPVVLREWQRADLRKIYDNPHGTRTAIISFAKKNAKTSLAAMLLLLHLCGTEAIQNTQLPSTAQSKEQAAVLFKLAAKMVRLSPSLKPYITVRDTIKELYCPELGTLYKALSAEASTAHGQSPVFAVHDELGQVKGPVSELYNAIDNAMGAHANPMAIIISTQAAEDGDLLSILIDDAKTGRDPTVVLSLYTADMDLDPFSEEAIKQANPAYGDFLNAKEIRKQAENARNLPSQEALYRNYTLNQRVNAANPFISRSIWQSCAAEHDGLDGLEVFAGLDLSETSDLTALVMMALHQGVWRVQPIFWLPLEGLPEKSRTDRVPYDVWHREGHLETTPGKSIEYEYVAARLHSLHSEYRFRKIAFDRWNFKHLKPWLLRAGFTARDVGDDENDADKEHAVFVEFGQGFQSMSPALRTLESLLLNKQLAHGGHPVLTMCASNATVQADPAGNRKLSKSKSHGRIDGMVALAMAAGISGAHVQSGPAVMPSVIFL